MLEFNLSGGTANLIWVTSYDIIYYIKYILPFSQFIIKFKLYF